MESVEGVRLVWVSLDEKAVTVVYDPSRCRLTDIVKAVERAGLEASVP